MKLIKWIAIGTGLIWLCSACQAQPTAAPTALPTQPPVITNTRLVLPPTWTLAPTQAVPATPTRPNTATIVPATITPDEYTAIPPTPDPIQPSLPDGAIPLRSQGWVISTHPENPAAALPYEMPDGSFGLALIDELRNGVKVSWTWQQEPQAASLHWQNVRRLTRTLDDTYLMVFLAQDTANQWYVGAVTLPSSGAQFIGVIPVQDVQNTFVAITNFDGYARQFWLVENGMLRMYQWAEGTAALLWEIADVPQDAVSPMLSAETDITKDGIPDLWLRWWPWSSKDSWITAIAWQQYFIPEWPGYRLIADLPPLLQYQDVDNDGVGEFLQPDAPDRPRNWQVFNWNGSEFVADASLAFPSVPTPQVPKLSQLPAIAAELTFTQSDGVYRWPVAGGELEKIHTPAETPSCNAAAVTQEVVSWSPDCAYAVVKLPAPIEGYTLGILNILGGGVIEIPNSFIYISGYSTFDWNQANGFVLHARAGNNPGLYRVALDSGFSETIFTLSALDTDPLGVTDPFAFPDGSIGFAIQGYDERLYPPFGIYRRMVDGTWQMLADLPALSSNDPNDAQYGTVQWSPDGSMFLFHAPFYGGEQPPYSILLIGAADANLLLDINPVLGKASNFVWR